MYPESQRDPYKIEKILLGLMDPKEGSDFCHRIVMFGRDTCSARSARCEACPLSDLCEKRRKDKEKATGAGKNGKFPQIDKPGAV